MHRLTKRIPAIICIACGTAAADELSVPGDHPTIQAAIDDAADGDEIVVAPGTYGEALDLLGKAVTLRSTEGPLVTVVDASGQGTSAVTCRSGEGPDTIIEGFTFTGGTGTDQGFRRMGGGMYNHQSSPTVRHCVFEDNTVSAYEFHYKGSGGGMFNRQCSPTIVGCTFRSNELLGCSGWLQGGAGMYNEDASPAVIACRFLDNAGNNGGGIMNVGAASHPIVASCLFDGNEAQYSGGGINNTDGAAATITNTVFRGNGAWHGGGIYVTSGTATVTNCTLNRNVARWRAAGLFALSCTGPSAVTVTNSIFWDNRLEQDPEPGSDPPGVDEKEISADFGASPTVRYSIVQLGWPGAGNGDENPRFVAPGAGDLRLREISPAIDAGDELAVPSDDLDLDGDGDTDEGCPDLDLAPRVEGDGVDLGAYERQAQVMMPDVTGDGVVDVEDLLAVVMAWGMCPSGTSCQADVTGDGVVDGDDLIAVLAAW